MTWAGEIALKIDPKILSKLIPENSKVILIAGTNGKTTTAKLLTTVLTNAGKKVVGNASGANLLNGIVGTLIQKSEGDCYIFEVDENNLIGVIREMGEMREITVVLLNLFRDQLDRYGEVDKIAKDWEKLRELRGVGDLVINGDDPQLAAIGEKLKKKVFFFGLGDRKYFLKEKQHATDSIFCPECGTRLTYSGYYLSHLGEYQCEKCGFGHPKNDGSLRFLRSLKKLKLEGVYNFYNVLAVVQTARLLKIGLEKISAGLDKFEPAFGRMEKIGNTIILLSKNPAGFNESLRTVVNSNKKGPLLLVLNDRIPDGKDVSWIWDVDFETLQNYPGKIIVAGDRAYDLGLRLKYAGVPKTQINTNLRGALREVLRGIKGDKGWILATYSAMLEVRKILTGKKIL